MTFWSRRPHTRIHQGSGSRILSENRNRRYPAVDYQEASSFGQLHRTHPQAPTQPLCPPSPSPSHVLYMKTKQAKPTACRTMYTKKG